VNFARLHRFFAPDLDRHRIGRSLAVRGIGLIYLIAIASWWSQVGLLVGEEGLTPAARVLDSVETRLEGSGRSPFFALPNLFWFTGASDFAFHVVCSAGCFLAALVVAGYGAGPALVALWAIYLSLANTGGVFMSYQWDMLLLEAGFVAIFLCDWRLKSPWRNPPRPGIVNRIALVWAWFLVAKLMFFSGWVKLAWATASSPEWWPEGTALTYHYMTQPLPTWTAWWAHHLPDRFHELSLWPMYGIELGLPFAILFGRYGRLAAAVGFSLLMVLILATGNYTYFNWLTIVLCLPLVHDRLWPKWFRNHLRFRPLGIAEPDPASARRRFRTRLGLASPVLVGVALLNVHVVLGDLHRAPEPLLTSDPTPGWLDTYRSALEPFRLASGYGLFRTMTTERPEIILEGSREGVTWFEYDFHWKVDDLADRPRFVAPHQPRVAWQFWFAALERRFDYRSRNAAWIEALVTRLLRGDDEVEQLLERNPFPDSPPRYIRARLYDYRFTTPEERRRTGDWWKRVAEGQYLAPVSSRKPDDPS